LDYAHRRQIIHRDVSPANILVSWEGEVKLSDFGVAKVVGGPGRVIGPTHGLKGNLGYMAPEQMRAQAIDARADVYALGVVLYELLTGKNPMRNGPVVPPPLPSTVPAELAAIVLRAVERNRDDRFTSAADVREAILHVPGQPADPARQLADFLGELRGQRGGGLDEALIDAVLGGKPATRVAHQTGPPRSMRLVALALALALAGGGAVFFGLRHRRVQTIAPPPRVAPAPVAAAPLPQEAPIAVGPIVVRPTPPPHPHQRGLLSINAIPWANLFVDGRAVGHTPRRKLVLEAGKHQLRLVTQAGESRSRTVEIAPNRETTLTVVFSEP
ncbi:MAG: protein kinase domain-containing protein, partial [Polyangia bacterium]